LSFIIRYLFDIAIMLLLLIWVRRACNEAEWMPFRNALDKSERSLMMRRMISRTSPFLLALVLAGHIIQRNWMEYFRWWHMNISTGYPDI